MEYIQFKFFNTTNDRKLQNRQTYNDYKHFFEKEMKLIRKDLCTFRKRKVKTTTCIYE